MTHQQLYKKLKSRQSVKSRELVIMPPLNNLHLLPAYAQMYIKPPYELITDLEGLIEFVQHFVGAYSEGNPAQKMCISVIVFPIYKSLTGRNYDVNYFKAMI